MAEATPFAEARELLPTLRAACKWAELDGTWGYARARASELHWQRQRQRHAQPLSTARTPAVQIDTGPSHTRAVPQPAEGTKRRARKEGEREGDEEIATPGGYQAAPKVTVGRESSATPIPVEGGPTGAASRVEGHDGGGVGAAGMGRVESGERGAEAVPCRGAGEANTRAADAEWTWTPDPGLYCICREGDDGGIMVSCDKCSEWFHARW